MRDIIPPARKLIEDHEAQSGRDHHDDGVYEIPVQIQPQEESREEVFYELPEYSDESINNNARGQTNEENNNTPVDTNMLGHKEEKAFQSLYQKPIKQTPLEEPKSSKLVSLIISLLVVSGLAAVGVMTFVFNRADVVLTPKLSEVPVNSTIVYSANEVTEGVKVQRITLTESASKAILRRGEKNVETKAEGTIVIYNNYSTAEQKLVKNTRFESSNGKVYRINDSVTVPGMSGTTPGSLEVKVYADSVGTDYNSGPMDFTIPGFKGTPRYTGFYARSKGSLTGGYSGKMSVVAPEDLQNADSELTESIKGKLSTKITESVPNGYVLVEDSVVYTATDNRDVLASDPDVEFSMQVSAVMFVVEKKSLESEILSKNGVGDTSRTIDNLDSLAIKTAKDGITSGFAISVSGSAQVGSVLNESLIKEKLAGVSEGQFESVISEFGGVDVAELDIRPYWISKIPTDIEKINITVKN